MDDSYYKNRDRWLSQNDYTLGDVMADPMGQEFVYDKDEGNPLRKIFIENVI